MEKKVRVGVIGVGRGRSMINYCVNADNAQIVAICDKWEKALDRVRSYYGESIAYYTSYDEFLKHDMDVVILANYSTEHAPFAVKAMQAGHHVISEVLPFQNMKEAVELIECVEKTGKIYCYAENYCYMEAPWEMRKIYQAGRIGELDYAEGEYIHNCERNWPDITYGDKDHWRNRISAFFYCTHSFGPIRHITGLRPVKVVGFEAPFRPICYRMGYRAGVSGTEMVTMENGGIVRSTHGNLKRNSVWYSLQGTLGSMETQREMADSTRYINHLFYDLLPADDSYLTFEHKSYDPKDELSEKAGGAGHGGSDYRCMWNAMEKILGNDKADTIDVYEAAEMCMVGLFAHFSVLNGGKEMLIPNLRNPEERDKWRNDTRCTDPKAAGDQLIPSVSTGTPDIPDSVYDDIRTIFESRHPQL